MRVVHCKFSVQLGWHSTYARQGCICNIKVKSEAVTVLSETAEVSLHVVSVSNVWILTDGQSGPTAKACLMTLLLKPIDTVRTLFDGSSLIIRGGPELAVDGDLLKWIPREDLSSDKVFIKHMVVSRFL